MRTQNAESQPVSIQAVTNAMLARASTHELLTADRAMLELLQLSETISKSKAAILIQGEQGTGKRTLAHWVHRKSQRMHKALEVLDCSRVARGEQEAEFYRRLELAHGGSFLLNEVSDLSPYLQTKLLQVMTDGVFLKPGTSSIMPVDVRIMATSTLPLSSLVKSGNFREDLFQRLNVVNLKTPSLQDRMGDIELLAKHFLKKWAIQNHRGEMSLASDAIALLNGHRFLGNITELDGVIERAVLVSQGNEVRARDIQIRAASDALAQGVVLQSAWKPGKTLDEIERHVILEALGYHSGNRTHTAKALGISIRTLRNKLAEYRVMGINV